MHSDLKAICSLWTQRISVYFVIGVTLIWTKHTIKGQGRMIIPPGRLSMWRLGYDTEINHNDNVQNCGGTLFRYTKASGKCGLCGEAWNIGPQDNTANAINSNLIVTGVYNPGSTVDVVIDDVVASGGYFEFRLCDTNNNSQKCFENGLLTIRNSVDQRYYDIKNGENKLQLILPENVTCDSCILQWKYRTAEHYGCNKENGTEKCCFGCGEIQNEYYACADIAIVNGDTNDYAVKAGHDVIQDNVKIRTLRRKKRAPVGRMGMQEEIQIMTGLPSRNPVLPYTPIINRRMNRLTKGILGSSPGELQWSWSRLAKRKTRNGARSALAGSLRNGQTARQPEGADPLTEIRSLNGGRGGGITINTDSQPIFNGNKPPMPSMIRVDRPVRTQILRNGLSTNSMPFFPARERSNFRRTLIAPISPTADALMIRSFGQEAISRYSHNSGNCKALGPFRTKEMDDWCNSQCPGGNCVINECTCNGKPHPSNYCRQCPYGKCMDEKKPDLNAIYPGVFNNYSTFLECDSYDRIYGLGNYKVLYEGLPECGHARFKRQITIPLEAEEYGCCGTRPQVIMPLTVKSKKSSYNVVQLPEDRNQFLVRGVCGRNSTGSCPMCVPEYNFQWVLVYDPRLDTNPPVNFVPVKFAHYCRCVNPGYSMGK